MIAFPRSFSPRRQCDAIGTCQIGTCPLAGDTISTIPDTFVGMTKNEPKKKEE